MMNENKKMSSEDLAQVTGGIDVRSAWMKVPGEPSMA